LLLRARVLLWSRRLDRLLAAGVDPSWAPELELRAAQVTSWRRRRHLALSLDAAVSEAHRPPRWSCAAPLDRNAVRAAAPALLALAAGLAADIRPGAQGVELAKQLVTDSSSPLYAPGDEQELREMAQIARHALA
jgi:hypothetical protein